MATPVLVLIHGYPFDHSMWDPVVALLPKSLQVLAPDLPGFGAARVSDADPSLDVMARSVAQLLDETKVGLAAVAGMSMGGYVALAFAEQYPAKLAGLGLISTQAGADAEEARAARRAMIERVR